MIVRKARPEDIPELVIMGEEFFAHTRYAEKTRYDYTSIIKCLAGLIKNGCLIVAVEEDIVAFFGAGITSICWNENQKIASELFWWGTPKGMILVYREAVKQLKGHYLGMSSLLNMKPETTKRFYEKEGFENMGNFYFRRL